MLTNTIHAGHHGCQHTRCSTPSPASPAGECLDRKKDLAIDVLSAMGSGEGDYCQWSSVAFPNCMHCLFFLSCDQNSHKSNLEKVKVSFGSELKGAVHHCKEVMAKED